MDQPVVVGVDGSEPSLRAVDWAADEAALREVPLHVVYASLWQRYEQAVFPTAPGRSEQILTDVLVVAAAKRARQRAPGTEVTTEVVPEGPVPVLRRAARKACALVIGSRGRGGAAELLLGSVGLAVAGRADAPVIVVRGAQSAEAVGAAQPLFRGGWAGARHRPPPATRQGHRASAARLRVLRAPRRRRCPLYGLGVWSMAQLGLVRAFSEATVLPVNLIVEGLAE
ncbi:universal stress protein [Streptomyces collinus]|uniref:universal stress protein n=1 Tax=Streptomyces collinus TaxID=42684 RepID=UPI003687FE9A